MLRWDEGDFYDVSFAVHKSRRYHAKMRGFYRNCYNLTTAATAVTGSSAFVALIGAPDSWWLAKCLTGVVAVASTLNLVFGLSKKADLHDDLCRRFTQLGAKMEEWPASEEYLQRARAERLLIEMDEPTEKRLVDLQAQNEEARARGASPDNMVPLSRWQFWFGYVVTFGMRRIDAWANDRKRAHVA